MPRQPALLPGNWKSGRPRQGQVQVQDWRATIARESNQERQRRRDFEPEATADREKSRLECNEHAVTRPVFSNTSPTTVAEVTIDTGIDQSASKVH